MPEPQGAGVPALGLDPADVTKASPENNMISDNSTKARPLQEI